MRFRSDPARIRGSIAPVVSPFTADGLPDLESLRGLVRWQLESGSHGISLGGSTGEPSAQSTAERANAIRAVAEEIDDRVPFVPGTGSAKLDETLELTAAADRAGADAVLIITPYYARPTQEGLFSWYSTVAREFPDLPMIAYNVPSRTAVDIAPETVARLRKKHDNIVGVKETTGLRSAAPHPADGSGSGNGASVAETGRAGARGPRCQGRVVTTPRKTTVRSRSGFGDTR
jgi:4-hydroxy-tetrahydrodipicolinate synthase